MVLDQSNRPSAIPREKKKPLILGLILLPGMVCIGGCADDDGAETKRVAEIILDTLNGIPVVKGCSGRTWAKGEGWTVREEFRLGAVNGPEEVSFGGHLTSVSVGPHGNLFVLDFQSKRITVFDGSGSFLRRFGGPGEGPGEFDYPVAMGWDSKGRLWVAGAFSYRYTVFDSLGGLIKTVPRAVRIMGRRQYPLWFDRNGHFVDEGPGGDVVHLLQVDTTGLVVDTLPPLKNPDRPRPVILPPGVDKHLAEYLPSLRWAIAPDGTVWLAESGSLQLIQRTLAGDTLRIIGTDPRDTAPDPEAVRQLEDLYSESGVDLSRFRLGKPIVQALHALDDGHVLVQIGEGVGHYSGKTMDVIDPDGCFLGSIDLGFNLTALGIPVLYGDTIVGIAIGELDVPFVVRGTIHR